MTKLWTGLEFKENASPTEVRAGMDHIKRALQQLRREIQPSMPHGQATLLLEKIDLHIGHYNASAAALNEIEVRAALADRGRIIDELEDDDHQAS